MRVRAFVFGLVLGGAGCNRAPATGMDFRHNRAGGGTPIAWIGSDTITVEEIQQRMLEMSPYARARYSTPEQRKDYVEGLSRFEVLAQEGVRRGLQNDPDVVETTKKVLVQKLIQQELDNKASPITDEEIRAYYEKHKSDYVKPELTRLSDLFVARAKGKAHADALREQAKALKPLDFGGFTHLVHENSEDAKTLPSDGDMKYLSSDELLQQYGKEVHDAAALLKTNGDLSEVITTDQGFYILKLQGRQGALNLSAEQVKPQLQGRILNERRQASFDKLLKDLEQKSHYRLDDAALAKVQVDMKAQAAPSHHPPPGFIPDPVEGGSR